MSDWLDPVFIYDDDFIPNDYMNRKPPMTEKLFHDSYNHYETLDEAVKGASRRATRNMTEVTVYQAVKKVSPKTPEVDIVDIKV